MADLDDLLNKRGLGRRKAPTGFGWDFNTYPVKVYRDGPRHFMTDFDPVAALFASDWKSWPVIYYDVVSGNNGFTGTSRAQAVATEWKARQLGIAAANAGGYAGYGIISLVKSDTGIAFVDRGKDFNDTGNSGGEGGNIVSSKPFFRLSEGGMTYTGPCAAGLAWTFDSTSKTYSATRSSVASVIDVSVFNRWGIFKRLKRLVGPYATLAAAQAAVGAVPGSWASNSATSDVTVRMENDVVPSDATLRVALTAADAFQTGTQPFWMSGFGIVGGAGSVGGLSAIMAATRNLIVDDSDISFAGADGGTARNNINIDNMTGMAVFRRVKSAGSLVDAFNFHATGAANLHALLVDCEATDAGHPGASPASQSCQNFTCHENVKLIGLNLRGLLAAGGCVRNIDQSQMWDLGSEYGYDRGDLGYGGTRPSAGVVIDGTGKYWGDEITVRGCAETFYASAGAEVRLNNPLELGGRRGGAGLIDTYVP